LSQSANSSNDPTITIGQLWREFLPLSLSDVTMAFGDPLMTITLTRLPDARVNLAAAGIARSLAICLESPIIMILHASNALAPTLGSRRALWRFVLLAGGSLSALLMLLAWPPIFDFVGRQLLQIPADLAPTVQGILVLVGLWPFAIAWRRYFQGILIYHGQAAAVANASLWRLGTVATIFGLGYWQQASGAMLAGLALVLGVIVEATVVTIVVKRRSAQLQPPPLNPEARPLPQTIGAVSKFYWPLANSMVVTWAGRTLLVGIVARAFDAKLALAAWPAAWGLVVLIANSTRMVQQITIKYRHRIADRQLFQFALTVGLVGALVLGVIGTTPIGMQVIQLFVGGDRELAMQMRPVLWVCFINPLLVALLNAMQGMMVSEGRTGSVNLATWLGTGALLLVASLGVNAGLPGAIAAAGAMLAASLVEVGGLMWQRRVAQSN
jgi:progressive ankylosis protein